jgi:hypothetical protein
MTHPKLFKGCVAQRVGNGLLSMAFYPQSDEPPFRQWVQSGRGGRLLQ